MKTSARANSDDHQQRLFATYGAALKAYQVQPTDGRWSAVLDAYQTFHRAFVPGCAVPKLVRPGVAA